MTSKQTAASMLRQCIDKATFPTSMDKHSALQWIDELASSAPPQCLHQIAEPTAQGLDALSDAARHVIAERQRQISAEGWTPDRDDAYNRGVLAEAGGIYALHAFDPRRAKETPEGWPWADAWWKPKDPRSNLIRAGALILAEIERLDRSFASQAKLGEPDGK